MSTKKSVFDDDDIFGSDDIGKDDFFANTKKTGADLTLSSHSNLNPNEPSSKTTKLIEDMLSTSTQPKITLDENTNLFGSGQNKSSTKATPSSASTHPPSDILSSQSPSTVPSTHPMTTTTSTTTQLNEDDLDPMRYILRGLADEETPEQNTGFPTTVGSAGNDDDDEFAFAADFSGFTEDNSSQMQLPLSEPTSPIARIAFPIDSEVGGPGLVGDANTDDMDDLANLSKNAVGATTAAPDTWDIFAS